MGLSLIIIEDDQTIRETLSEVFRKEGFKCICFEKGRDAIRFVKGHSADIVILDLRLPDIDGLKVLDSLKKVDEDLPVIIMTAYPEVKTAVSAIKAGAYDYINKPFELEELKILVKRIVENRHLRSRLLSFEYQQNKEDSVALIGESAGMKELLGLMKRVASSQRTPVLITGESGVGKELVARAIHRMSQRASGPFVKVNCTAIPESLLESELFGYEKGAFTDAKTGKKGLFELASGGTIFLDEIGDLQISIQPKLLQVLETQTFRKVGGLRDITVDVRIITATNQDLKRLVEEKRFRQDLYYRLNVFHIHVPPLRERKEDILPLARFFLDRYRRIIGKKVEDFSEGVMEIFLHYSWPGNVRELKNVVERAVILATGSVITPDHIPPELREGLPGSGPRLLYINRESLSLSEVIEEVEKAHIKSVLSMVNNNKSKAAHILGISRYTLREKIKKYNLQF